MAGPSKFVKTDSVFPTSPSIASFSPANAGESSSSNDGPDSPDSGSSTDSTNMSKYFTSGNPTAPAQVFIGPENITGVTLTQDSLAYTVLLPDGSEQTIHVPRINYIPEGINILNTVSEDEVTPKATSTPLPQSPNMVSNATVRDTEVGTSSAQDRKGKGKSNA